VKYFKCHRLGHMIKNCHLGKKGQRANKSTKDTDDVNLYIESDTYARDEALRTNKKSNSSRCCIVSGYTLHMRNDVDMFKDINSYERGKFKLANNRFARKLREQYHSPRREMELRKWCFFLIRCTCHIFAQI